MISVVMRVLLILFSVGMLFFVLRSVRKAKVLIDDIIFWVLCSALFIVLAIFPQLASWAAGLLGIQSPINLIYLLVIFVLMVKVFRASIRLSQLETKIRTLTQEVAAKEYVREEKEPGSAQDAE